MKLKDPFQGYVTWKGSGGTTLDKVKFTDIYDLVNEKTPSKWVRRGSFKEDRCNMSGEEPNEPIICLEEHIGGHSYL